MIYMLIVVWALIVYLIIGALIGLWEHINKNTFPVGWVAIPLLSLVWLPLAINNISYAIKNKRIERFRKKRLAQSKRYL